MKHLIKYLVVFIVIICALGVWKYLAFRGQIKSAFTHNIVVKEQLGKVKVISLSISELSSHCESGCERFLAELEGDKGKAWAESDVTFDGVEISDGILCLDNGQIIPLTPESIILKNADGSRACQ